MLQEYLDQLFDAFKEGICISDVEGTVVHLNRRHAEITGIPREEMLGHSDISTTQVYARVSPKKLFEDMDKFIEATKDFQLIL